MTSRKSQYLIATRSVPGFPPVPVEQVQQLLNDTPDVESVKVLAFRSGLGTFPENIGGPQRVIVARMPDSSAQMLQQAAGPRLIIERDHLLSFPAEAVPLCADPGIAVAPGEGFTVTITVMGSNGPVPRAQVYLFGSQWPARGITDKNGEVELTIDSEAPEAVRGLFVKPEADFWSLWLPNPNLDRDGDNVVTLTSLRETIPNFPKTALTGWGLRALKIDQLPPNFRGQGIKVGLIDTGISTHDGLKRVKEGIDLTSNDRQGWKEDEAGHGTFCAGIIAANADGGGVRGCAPEVELLVCKLYPGGRYSDLLQALESCIEQQVDIINLNLGGPEPSELIEQALLKAKLVGIACITAAGDSGSPLQGLAASPTVLTASALGKFGEFPPNSYHAHTIAGRVTAEGYFSARFTSFGPQVGICAPGVAVISTAPGNGYAVGDGTSVAAAHITGLAALILAHHPEFQVQGAPAARSPQRVERLFQVIKQSAQLLDVGDISRTGLGLPDATRAFAPEPFAVLHGGLGAMQSVMSPLSAFAGLGGIPNVGTLGSVARPVPFPVAPASWPFPFTARPAASSTGPTLADEQRGPRLR
ncbi:MAG: S8 family serine peptidase [Terriglobales bacterium]